MQKEVKKTNNATKLLVAIDILQTFIYENRHGLDKQQLITELYKLFTIAQEVRNESEQELLT